MVSKKPETSDENKTFQLVVNAIGCSPELERNFHFLASFAPGLCSALRDWAQFPLEGCRSDKDTEFLPILNWIKRYEEINEQMNTTCLI